MVTKKGPKPTQSTKPTHEQCADEIDFILSKYKCTIICQPKIVHGQQVFFPMIVEVPPNELKK